MAAKMCQFGFFAILALTICSVATAQSSSCSSTMMSLSSCLSFVTGNVSAPTPGCCTSLSNAVQSQPQCLCPLLTGTGAGSSVGIVINQTLATALPNLCNVQTPPVSNCDAVANGPAPAGEPAPAPSALNSPTDPSTDPAEAPATTTTTTVPSIPAGGSGSRTGPNASDGASIRSSINLPVAALFVISWIAIANTYTL